MSQAEKIIGAAVRALREQRGLSGAALAAKAGVRAERLDAIETGAAPSASLGELELLAAALQMPFRAVVSAAYAALEAVSAPKVEARYLRTAVPLPGTMTHAHLAAALNDCQSVIHLMNKNMRAEVGKGLQELIQGNNFSGLVSNVLSNSMDKCTPFKHNHHQKYPDLIENPGPNQVGLEIKTTIQLTKGESPRVQ